MFVALSRVKKKQAGAWKLMRLLGSCYYAYARVFQNTAVCYGCSGNHPFRGFSVVYWWDDGVLLSRQEIEFLV